MAPVGGLLQSGDRFFTACLSRVAGSLSVSHYFLAVSCYLILCSGSPLRYPTSSELLLTARLPSSPSLLPAPCHCRFLAFGACACVKCCPGVSLADTLSSGEQREPAQCGGERARFDRVSFHLTEEHNRTAGCFGVIMQEIHLSKWK